MYDYLCKTVNEALYKGITASGRRLKTPNGTGDIGVLLSVDKHDNLEVVSLAKKLHDLGFKIYATRMTAESIESLGIEVTELDESIDSSMERIYELLESGKISFVVYTGALMDQTLNDYIALSRRALLLNIPCFTSLDTAMATADIIASHYNEHNTSSQIGRASCRERVSSPV